MTTTTLPRPIGADFLRKRAGRIRYHGGNTRWACILSVPLAWCAAAWSLSGFMVAVAIVWSSIAWPLSTWIKEVGNGLADQLDDQADQSEAPPRHT